MGRIKILDITTKDPITMIGRMSGICYNTNTDNALKNFQRGLKNLESGHGRTFEFPDVYMEIEGYSARVIREWYTHIGGMPTRLQASTRYINYSDFDYIVPHSINTPAKLLAYTNVMNDIKTACTTLNKLKVPKEDIANVLPLGMTTKIVDKRNLRNLIDMSHQRMCNRAYWEYRQLFNDIRQALMSYSDEWQYLVSHYFLAKCDISKCCTEEKGCGKYPMPTKEHKNV